MPSTDHQSHPDARYRFFIYDPQGDGHLYFKSAEARDAAHDQVIQGYLDDAWDEAVEQIIAGEVTHTCQQVGREDRPADVELDAEQCDGSGKYWGDWVYTCNYALLPLEPESVVDAEFLPVTSSVLPCLFCSGPARADLFDPISDTIVDPATPLNPEGDYVAYVWCHDCGAQGPSVDQGHLMVFEGFDVSPDVLRALAVERWNRHRSATPLPVTQDRP